MIHLVAYKDILFLEIYDNCAEFYKGFRLELGYPRKLRLVKRPKRGG